LQEPYFIEEAHIYNKETVHMNAHDELRKKGYIAYKSDDIIVYWNPKICQHTGKCIHGCPQTFNPRKRPWINLENGDAIRIAETIDSCPSGALKYLLASRDKTD
jgi:uncharacterized Fe-S cluster protein YjdI